MRELELELVVFASASGQERTTSVCVKCFVVENRCKSKVNIICFPLQVRT